ncbi:alpha/beta hydrolase [Rothia sp. P7208]|uniref:alpha/beta hydrolase n=1 Tax=Rothia sp. P7208 TaxID=3402660 RepID=UPI003ACE3C87
MTYTVEYLHPAPEQAKKHLVLLLHGYGSNEQDLLQIAKLIGSENITWASMRAPQPVGATIDDTATTAHIPAVSYGYQWFPLNQLLDSSLHSINLSCDYVNQWLDKKCADYDGITLLGFSQGMALATSIARCYPEKISAIIGLSGYIIETEEWAKTTQQLKQRQIPVFYGYGDQDPIIPTGKEEYTRSWLEENTNLELHEYSGMAHSVCPQEIQHVASFIQKNILPLT